MLTKMPENELQKPDIINQIVTKFGQNFTIYLKKQEKYAEILAINGYRCCVSFVSPTWVESMPEIDHFGLCVDYLEDMMIEIIQKDFPEDYRDSLYLEKYKAKDQKEQFVRKLVE